MARSHLRVASAAIGIAYALVCVGVAQAATDARWSDGLELSGDFTGRFDAILHDDLASDPNRARYRLRMALRAQINPYTALHFGFASGGPSNDRFVTLGGGGGNDFAPDEFDIDRAFLAFDAFAGRGGRPIGILTGVDLYFGKLENLFQSPVGEDLLLWDPDHTPEGAAASIAFSLLEGLRLTIDGGYLVLDEEGGARDPNVSVMQLDAEADLHAKLLWTFATTYLLFRDLDADFFSRVESSSDTPAYFGNVPGLTPDGDMWLIDHRQTLTSLWITDWPITLSARFIHNLSAVSTSSGAQENTAWSTAIELGDASVWLQAGFGYYSVQANALPSLLIDSELFDGHTNASGWLIFLRRQLLTNTLLELRVYRGRADRASLRDADAAGRYDRVRVTADVGIHF